MTVPPSEPPADRGYGPGRDADSEPLPPPRFSEPSDTEVDALFAAITADWKGDADPQVVDAEVVAVREDRQPHGYITDALTGGAATEEAPTEEAEPEEDEGHYEPPEPPPVPALARPTMGALALIVLGTVLLLAPGVIGLSGSTGFPLGLIVVSGGLTWLLSRLRTAPPPDSGWDDGARL